MKLAYRDKFMSDTSMMLRYGMIGPGLGVTVATIAHDKWCRLLKGKGDCNCNPTIEYNQHFATKK